MNARRSVTYFSLLALVVVSVSFVPRLYATKLIKLSLKEMTEKADAILIGRCVDVRSQWVGKKIFTYATLSVDNYLKGDMGSTVIVTQPGGRVETPYPLEMNIPGSPVFGLGEKVLVFVAGSSNGEIRVLRLSQGKVSVLKDRRTGEEVVIGSAVSEAIADNQGGKLNTTISRLGKVYMTDFVGRVNTLLGKNVANDINSHDLKELNKNAVKKK